MKGLFIEIIESEISALGSQISFFTFSPSTLYPPPPIPQRILLQKRE